jgi:succinoglycan biosynthesis protein ExoO
LNLRRAPYAIAAPWSIRDLLYLAAHVRPAEILIADYSFQAAALPYALLPQARTFVVMHDLFFRRTEQFRERGATDSVAIVSEHEELAMLGLADVVIAIQQDEAAHVRRCLPRQRVVVAPMATHVIGAPQPGTVPALLFIGSSAAPNVLGLRWFLASIWPRIRNAHAAAELWVVGGVCRLVDAHDPKVRFFGMVRDLGRVYRDAAVVICPLTVGSGLKIKLIEAMGRGKAIVATSVAVEGVREWVQPAVVVEDAPERFAAEAVALLNDPALRRERAERAQAVAAARFSPDACYRDLLVAMAPRRARGWLDNDREMPVAVCDH